MFGKFFGSRGKSGGPGGLFYRPYRNDAANQIYNLLFCDNPALFGGGKEGGGALHAVLADATERAELERIGNDVNEESRLRALAFNRLRAMQVAVPPKQLLGTIIEFPQRGGLDTLAIFPDRRLRYINQSEKMSVFEATPPSMSNGVQKVVRASQAAIDQHGPSDEPRRPPPKSNLVRLSFLASDGLYFAEGEYESLLEDQHAGAVMDAATDLLPVLVEEALKLARQAR